jgi:hypothetical protein
MVLVAALAASTASATPPPPCELRVTIQLTPDIPNALDKGFLSSLIGNHPSYTFVARSMQDGSILNADLNGPGPDYLCQSVIDAMRKDARVLSIEVNYAYPAE